MYVMFHSKIVNAASLCILNLEGGESNSHTWLQKCKYEETRDSQYVVDAQKFIKIIIIKTSNVILYLKAKKDKYTRDFNSLVHFWGDYK